MTHENNHRKNEPTPEMSPEVYSEQMAEQSNQTKEKRTQFLALLKSRYGYTNEKSIDELKRILKQFSRINRSLNFRRARRKSINSHVG
jgi:hypothetical protein